MHMCMAWFYINVNNKNDNWSGVGGGGGYSYVYVLPDTFFFKLMKLDVILKETCRAEHEHTPFTQLVF